MCTKVFPLTIMGVAYTAIGTEIWRVTYLRSTMMKYCIHLLTIYFILLVELNIFCV